MSGGEYVATLYAEGGAYDGETFACGPFGSLTEAVNHADDMADLGQTAAYPLSLNAATVRAAVQS